MRVLLHWTAGIYAIQFLLLELLLLHTNNNSL